MKKRAWCMILALLLLLSLLPAASTEAFAEIYSGNCGFSGDNAKWTLDSETGVLTVTGDGPMGEMLGMQPWMEYKDLITSVVIEAGITRIGQCSFRGYKNLVKLSLPGTVESIEQGAFQETGLKELVIPEGVRGLENGAFRDCLQLTTLTLPLSVGFFGYGVFSNCPNLTDVYYAGSPLQWAAIQTFDHSLLDEDNPNLVIHFGASSLDAFTDLEPNAWYRGAVEYVIDNGLMNGTGEGKFEPLTVSSRAMVVQIMYNISKRPTVFEGMGKDFSDVKPGDWFSDAVRWASEYEIASGYEDGRFGPNDSVQREQIAVFLFNCAKRRGWDMSIAADLSAFPDADKVSEWARPALSWAVVAGILSGKAGNNGTFLDPQGEGTRAELASMVMRFWELAKNASYEEEIDE